MGPRIRGDLGNREHDREESVAGAADPLRCRGRREDGGGVVSGSRVGHRAIRHARECRMLGVTITLLGHTRPEDEDDSQLRLVQRRLQAEGIDEIVR